MCIIWRMLWPRQQIRHPIRDTQIHALSEYRVIRPDHKVTESATFEPDEVRNPALNASIMSSSEGRPGGGHGEVHRDVPDRDD
jgi:hypothetical protein